MHNTTKVLRHARSNAAERGLKMQLPAKNETSASVSLQITPGTAYALSAWLDEFYSNPSNRKAYADWCAANGLESDLHEEDFAPNWREV